MMESVVPVLTIVAKSSQRDAPVSLPPCSLCTVCISTLLLQASLVAAVELIVSAASPHIIAHSCRC